jgi:hypothetical protein
MAASRFSSAIKAKQAFASSGRPVVPYRWQCAPRSDLRLNLAVVDPFLNRHPLRIEPRPLQLSRWARVQQPAETNWKWHDCTTHYHRERREGSGTPVPDLSIAVNDFDDAQDRAKATGFNIEFGLQHEP